MTEALGEPGLRPSEDDETAPFALERTADPERAPGPPLAAPEVAPDIAPDMAPEVAPAVAHEVTPEIAHGVVTPGARETPIPLVDPASLPLDRMGRRAARFVTQALLLDALVLVGLAVACGVRLRHEGAGAPDLLLGGLALVLALPCLLAARSLYGLGRGTATDDAHRFAQGIAHLRGIFVLKATLLFATLGLGCFTFSLLVSLFSLM